VLEDADDLTIEVAKENSAGRPAPRPPTATAKRNEEPKIELPDYPFPSPPEVAPAPTTPRRPAKPKTEHELSKEAKDLAAAQLESLL
jgi:hypothetical protein